jgi:hypothetical protein
VPRKRIQPNKRWLISKPSRPAARPLSAAQRTRLKQIDGLPEVALPAVEEIAAGFIRLASDPIPSNAEMRASLRALRSRVAALQKQLKETDLYTMHLMSANYVRRALRDPRADPSFPDLPSRIESGLGEFAEVIDFVTRVLGKSKISPAGGNQRVPRKPDPKHLSPIRRAVLNKQGKPSARNGFSDYEHGQTDGP